jgi:hypothetical protein
MDGRELTMTDRRTLEVAAVLEKGDSESCFALLLQAWAEGWRWAPGICSRLTSTTRWRGCRASRSEMGLLPCRELAAGWGYGDVRIRRSGRLAHEPA